MNVQHSLIRQLMLYEFELSPNAAKTTKTICCAKDEGTVNDSIVTRWSSLQVP